MLSADSAQFEATWFCYCFIGASRQRSLADRTYSIQSIQNIINSTTVVKPDKACLAEATVPKATTSIQVHSRHDIIVTFHRFCIFNCEQNLSVWWKSESNSILDKEKRSELSKCCECFQPNKIYSVWRAWFPQSHLSPVKTHVFRPTAVLFDLINVRHITCQSYWRVVSAPE